MSSTTQPKRDSSADDYPTNPKDVSIILPFLQGLEASSTVLDPCAGTGELLEAIRYRKGMLASHLSGIELVQARAKLCSQRFTCIEADALSPIQTWSVRLPSNPSVGVRPDFIITNPPFSLAEELVRKAMECKGPNGTVAMLMRLAMLEGKKRKDLWASYPADVFIFGKRPSFTSNGKSDSAAYAWFVWGEGRGNRWWRLDE